MPKLTPEELAAAREMDTRSRSPRFPSALTATLAAKLLGPDLPDTTDRAPYVAATKRAILLLDVCQEELLRDASERVFEEAQSLQNAAVMKHRQNLEHQFPTGLAQFRAGLLYITRRHSLADAQQLFRRWRRFVQEQPDVFPLLVRAQGPNPEDDISAEFAEYRKTGFDLETLETLRRSVGTWMEEFEKPSVRARVGRRGGTTPRRKRKGA